MSPLSLFRAAEEEHADGVLVWKVQWCIRTRVRVHRLGNIIEINHQKLKKANKTYDRYTVPFEHTPAPYVCFLVGVEPEAS